MDGAGLVAFMQARLTVVLQDTCNSLEALLGFVSKQHLLHIAWAAVLRAALLMVTRSASLGIQLFLQVRCGEEIA